MRSDISVRILLLIFLVLNALNLGCGGGAEVTSSVSQAPVGDVSAAKRVQSPVLGFVYATGGTEARAINGIPGASTLSSPLTVPEGVTSLDFAPGQKYALVERADGASLGLIPFSGADPGPLVQIAGGISKPDVISFSPNGVAAALYSASQGRLQVLAGLPDNPQLTREMSSGELPDAVRLLAIADDGVTLLEGTVNSAVYLLAGGGPQMLESVTDLGGIVFTPQSNDALIFDRSTGTLSLMQGVSSVRSNRLLANGLTGLGGNIALETDGHRAIITTSSASHLWEIDFQSLAVQDMQLPTTPAMLEPLRLSGHYLLTWQPGQPAWILNTNQEKGAVYFVPAAVEARAALAR
jgi:hypothetical protein